jgi:hypothetical protein
MFKKKQEIKKVPEEPAFTPSLLRETENYRIIVQPYKKDGKWIKQLVIEKRNKNTLGEPYFSITETDYDPDGSRGYIQYYPRELWSFLKEMFLKE